MSNPHSLHHRPAHQPTSSAVTSPNYRFIVTNTLHSSGSPQGTKTFRFRKMPFGLCNSGATLQRPMDVVMNGSHLDVLQYGDTNQVPLLMHTQMYARKSHSSKNTLLYSDTSTSRRTAYTVTITQTSIILFLKNKNLRPARKFSTLV